MSASKILPGKIIISGTGPSDTILFSFGTRIFTFGNGELCKPFVTSLATLTYDSDDQLTGRRLVYGTIGTSVNFTFDNGPTAVGTLDSPFVPQWKPDGNGTWNKGE